MTAFEIHEHTLTQYNGRDKRVIVPQHITEIGEFAFYNCETIQEIILPKHLKSIGSFAFYSCSSLIHIDIPEQVELIGNGAFSYCAHLESIILPQSLKSIAKSTFYQCPKLKTVIIPENVTHIDHSAFGFCRSLTAIQLPTNLETIEAKTFLNCSALQQIILPSHLKAIKEQAFYHCQHLAHLQLPASLEQIGKSALQTFGPLTITSSAALCLQPQMFDAQWNLMFNRPDPDNYQLFNSYLPHVNLAEWKPYAQDILLMNFLETQSHHTAQSTAYYRQACQENKERLLKAILDHKRYVALNQALEIGIFTSQDIAPYLHLIEDREEKAQLLSYSQQQQHHALDDLENDLDHWL